MSAVKPYMRDATFSGHIQDIERLVVQASELGASSIEINHKDTRVVVKWDRDGQAVVLPGGSS